MHAHLNASTKKIVNPIDLTKLMDDVKVFISIIAFCFYTLRGVSAPLTGVFLVN